MIQLIGITKPRKCVLDNKVKLERTKKKEFCKNDNKSFPTSELFQSGIASGHSGASDKQTVLNKHTLSGSFYPIIKDVLEVRQSRKQTMVYSILPNNKRNSLS